MPIAPWIIEEIRKREQQKKRRDDRPQPQIEIPQPPPRPGPPREDPDEKDRGVIIIDPDGSEERNGRGERGERQRGVYELQL
jgi:hypothetical protein